MMEQINADKLQQMIPTGLIGWYPFQTGARILYIGSTRDAYVNFLKERHLEHCVWSIDELLLTTRKEEFDYIICVAIFEKVEDPSGILACIRQALKPSGVLLLGANNRYGLRYFCGDRDIYTDRNFDGIENYQRAYSNQSDQFLGRMYSRKELKSMLTQAGLTQVKCYSVLSDLDNPTFLYAENYVPNEDLSNRLFPTYSYPKTVFLEEQTLYEGLIDNGMFHQMANAYLMECTIGGRLSDVRCVTASLERGEKDALYTVIHEDNTVEKRAAFPQGQMRLRELNEHIHAIKEKGLAVIEGRLDGSGYVMPYETAELAQVYLKRLLHMDREAFIAEMDHFRDLILQSSQIISEDIGDGEGAVLQYGYLDMVPLNAFYKNGTYVFFDQEFRMENCPANAVIWRMIVTFYAGDTQANAICPRETLFERYNLKRQEKRWRSMEWEFIGKLRKEQELEQYHQRVRANYQEIHSNRQRINYSAREYQRLFINIFDRADTRKLFLFGSGNFTKKFLQIYAKDYPVYAILDNNSDRWGQRLDGIEIMSPDVLLDLEPAEYKVIICINNYLSVMKQLDQMGVGDYAIYDRNQDYPRKRKQITVVSDENIHTKKYHIGYVAGAFDMFHVGHLNLLRKAKEQCDYLIVGVLPDESIREKKKKLPIIPQEDRVEIVEACKYVDQAEILPVDFNGIMDAYRMFHFDVQFSGNDHIEDDKWRTEQQRLEQVGADIMYFDYTQKVSSTSLREKLKSNLE